MPPETVDRRQSALRAVVFLVVVAGVVVLAWKLGGFRLGDRRVLMAAIQRVRGLPLLMPVFIVAYAVAVTFGLPASPFTLAGGALFGFWRGFLMNWLGATSGALLAYLFAGALCGEGCRALLGRRSRELERLAGKHGFMTTLRLRLIPVVPFGLLNFAAALAGVRRRDYMAATALGIIPGTAIYTYFADSLLQGAAGASHVALARVALAGGLLIALSFVPALIHRWSRH